MTTPLAQQLLSNSTSGNTTQPNTLLSVVTHSAVVESVEANLNTEVNSTLTKLQHALAPFIGATLTDSQYLDGLAALPNNTGSTRAYMAAVSPWFFTHYGADSFNKNVCFFVLFISSA